MSGAVAPALLSFGAAAPLSWLAEHRSRGTRSGLWACPSSDRGQGQDLNPTPALPRLVLLSPWWAASGYPQHSPGREGGSRGKGQSPHCASPPGRAWLSGATGAAGTCLKAAARKPRCQLSCPGPEPAERCRRAEEEAREHFP